MTRKTLTATLFLACAGGCGLPGTPTTAPAQGVVAALEKGFRTDPTRIGTSTLLSAAYLAQERSDDARRVVTTALGQLPGDPELTLALGLIEEAEGHDDAARRHYLDYLNPPIDRAFAAEACGRVEKLDRRAVSAEAASLVGGGALFSPERPGTVVVLPFVTPSGDEVLEPLSRTMAEVVAEDLGSSGLTAVSPALVRGILEGMDVSPDSWDDPAFAQRVGALLGAGLVLSGRITHGEGADVGVTAALLRRDPASTPTIARLETVVNISQMPAVRTKLFDLALADPGEEEGKAPTASGNVGSMAAWVLFGRALRAEDGGDLSLARDYFRHAYQLDHSFRRALERAQRTDRLMTAARPPGEEAWRMAWLGVQRSLVTLLRSSPAPGDGLERMGLRERAVLAELLGLDALGTGGIAGLVLVPGGGGL